MSGLVAIHAPTFQRAQRIAKDCGLERPEWVLWNEGDPHTWRGRQWGQYMHVHEDDDIAYRMSIGLAAHRMKNAPAGVHP